MNSRTVSSTFVRNQREDQFTSFSNSGNIFLGVDVGSTSSDVVVLNEANEILYSDYRRTMGRPVETLVEQVRHICHLVDPSRISLAAATGSAGRYIARMIDIPFVNEVPAQAQAIGFLYPEISQASVIEMGGQDSKLIFLTRDSSRVRVKDFSLNTVCAAGTGSFLDQQAQRLGIDIEDEFGRMAIASQSVPRMAGRCSVFAKSDMIHLQQQATPTEDIIAGLCMALARNLKSNLGQGRSFVKPIIFTGGVAANAGVIKAIEDVFSLDSGELVVPDSHFFTGAIGAVLISRKRSNTGSNGKLHIEKLERIVTQKSKSEKSHAIIKPLAKPTLPAPDSRVYDELLDNCQKPLKAYLGVDVGSISTNVAVIDEQNRVLAKAYLMTAGRPIEAVKKGLDMVSEKVAGKVEILAAATTGSGRYLTGDFIGADTVINEITAQAAGAAIVNPEVDTIFEIGGQDSKYISLNNGVVVDFEMNHACAAGTGSFLEEQAQRLGVNIKQEFGTLALKSKSPEKLGERCTVFMESDLLSCQQKGAATEDMLAGLSYSIVTNYLNRVVGRRRIGENICFQGGTAFNRAVVAAFESVTQKSITVPDHHEVTGAIGAAVIAAERYKELLDSGQENCHSSFKGFDSLVNVEYTVESFTCEHCPNNCEIKKVQLAGSEPLYYGSRCDRYNLSKNRRKGDGSEAFEFRQNKLLEYAGLNSEQNNVSNDSKTVGIPMALVNWQLLPLFSVFFRSLGFKVVLSGKTDKSIIRKGLESLTNQPCFPVKVAHGHIAELIEKKVDYIFVPSIVSMPVCYPSNKSNKLCPYVTSLPYQLQSAFAEQLGDIEILSPVLHMEKGSDSMRKGLADIARQLDVTSGKIKKAVISGMKAQTGFERSLKSRGKKILSSLKPDEKLFVLVSRPYNGCDAGVNLQLPRKLADMGCRIIPMDMLDLENAPLGDAKLHESVYWSYGQKILRAAEIIKNDSRLFAIYLSNFSCGPDSFLLTFFKDIMGDKPCLQIELDEHSADAGVITRLEAFVESLKNYKLNKETPKVVTTQQIQGLKKRTLHIPYMGDCSYGVAATFRAYGQPAKVMPLADESTLVRGRQFLTGKECLPCAITAGDMLKVVQDENFDPEKTAFFMPSASGPCRFGMYNCMHRLILRYAGNADIPIIAPNQDSSFYTEFASSLKGASARTFLKDMWIAAVGVDLMHKVLLRLRPFARDLSEIESTYDKSINKWLESVENKIPFNKKIDLMQEIAGDFASIELDHSCKKPRIGIVGEIYVRSHPFANDNVIKRLEELGACCELACLAEWVYYTNFTRLKNASRRKEFASILTNRIQNSLQHRIERELAATLEGKFGALAEDPVDHVIKLAEPYIHESFEGEAVLSVGKICEYYHKNFGGVVNVMPFSCMPSTIVSGQTMRLSAQCKEMPVLNVNYDGQHDATLETRLEAFVEQVRQRQELLCGASELLSV